MKQMALRLMVLFLLLFVAGMCTVCKADAETAQVSAVTPGTQAQRGLTTFIIPKPKATFITAVIVIQFENIYQ